MASSAWTKNIKDPKERKELTEVLDSPYLRNNFLKILDAIQAEEERLETTLDTYDNPSWAYKQADLNGAKRAYNRIRSLFNTKETKTSG